MNTLIRKRYKVYCDCMKEIFKRPLSFDDWLSIVVIEPPKKKKPVVKSNVKMLRVGDTVNWRGGWGEDPAVKAVISGIQVTRTPHMKYGISVQEISWDTVRQDKCVVDLDNNHWAYGMQLSPVDE